MYLYKIGYCSYDDNYINIAEPREVKINEILTNESE